MSGFFKKLFNRITGKSDQAAPVAPAPEALPAPEPALAPESAPLPSIEPEPPPAPPPPAAPPPVEPKTIERRVVETRTIEPVRNVAPTAEPVRRVVEPVRAETTRIVQPPSPSPPPQPSSPPEPAPLPAVAPPVAKAKKTSTTDKLKSIWPFSRKKAVETETVIEQPAPAEEAARSAPVPEPAVPAPAAPKSAPAAPKPAPAPPKPAPAPPKPVEIEVEIPVAKPEGKKTSAKRAADKPPVPAPVAPSAPVEPAVETRVVEAPVEPAGPPPKKPRGKSEKPVREPVAEIQIAPVINPPVEVKAGALRKAPPEPAAPPPPVEPEKKGWFSKLKEGLSKSSKSITGQITTIFTKRKLDASTLQDLEDTLIQADLGLAVSERIIKEVATGRYDKEVDPEEVKRILASEVQRVLAPVEVPFNFGEEKPFVILVVGVNGSGKTTTIGKLGAIAMQEGFKVKFAACDTFRAAAIEQLTVWGQRIGAETIWRPQGADAAGLAFDAMKAAHEDGTDILFIDTAGRLHNKTYLMDELDKVVRVIKKHDAAAPHAVLLVLDATTGQNALAQADAFTKVAGVTGLIMTKLDGTARGGILVAIAEKFRLPIHAIGVGEKIEDLQPFDAEAFSRAIAGLDEQVKA